MRAPDSSALWIVASHRDYGGCPLDVKVAAVKLISVLWPTVAVEEFIVFAALALHERPGLKDRVREDDGAFLDAFGAFRLDRFLKREPTAFDLVPKAAGSRT